MLIRYAHIVALLASLIGTKGFAPSAASLSRRKVASKSTAPGHQKHEHVRSGGKGTSASAYALPVLAASSSSASAPSPADFFAALFGGSKKVPMKRGARAEALEADLLSAIEGVQGRGRDVTQEQRDLVDKAVEALESDGGVPDAASSPLVDGSWRLIFTTTPGTASPVQRSFVGVDGFAIYQDIDLFSEVPPTVTNVVDFGPRVGQLRVTALASTPARPMDGFVPRKGDGRFFGLNILGVSQTEPPKDPSGRIDFQFDEAGFDFKALPFNIPYPVPFRLFGDEVKGWIDVTYLSERLRIARGNKGTLFVLQRPPSSPPSP